MEIPSNLLPEDVPAATTLYYPSQARTDHLIFFIPGNPGLIEYYRTFLSHLSNLVTASTAIIGISHAGFKKNAPYYSLDAQIEHKLMVLQSVQRALTEQDAPSQTPGTPARRRSSRLISRQAPKVILMGHSMGAWIIMEMLREIRSGNWTSGEVAGGVLLFPTITHLKDSPSGQKFMMLAKLPGIFTIADLFARFFTSVLPLVWLVWVIQKVTGQSRENAEITAGFLDGGVKQSLLMANEEMSRIAADDFPESIWGLPLAPARTKLLLYYGKTDHWVADHRRDELITARGELVGRVVGEEEDGTLEIAPKSDSDWKPRVYICEDGIPHGFCLDHSELMAAKVATWVNEMT